MEIDTIVIDNIRYVIIKEMVINNNIVELYYLVV